MWCKNKSALRSSRRRPTRHHVAMGCPLWSTINVYRHSCKAEQPSNSPARTCDFHGAAECSRFSAFGWTVVLLLHHDGDGAKFLCAQRASHVALDLARFIYCKFLSCCCCCFALCPDDRSVVFLYQQTHLCGPTWYVSNIEPIEFESCLDV